MGLYQSWRANLTCHTNADGDAAVAHLAGLGGDLTWRDGTQLTVDATGVDDRADLADQLARLAQHVTEGEVQISPEWGDNPWALLFDAGRVRYAHAELAWTLGREMAAGTPLPAPVA